MTTASIVVIDLAKLCIIKIRSVFAHIRKSACINFLPKTIAMFRSEADEEITKVWVPLSSIACFTFKTEEANKQKYLQGKVFVLAFLKRILSAIGCLKEEDENRWEWLDLA